MILMPPRHSQHVGSCCKLARSSCLARDSSLKAIRELRLLTTNMPITYPGQALTSFTVRSFRDSVNRKCPLRPRHANLYPGAPGE